MPATNMLTQARNGLWDAIDNWSPLAGTFKRKYRFDKPGDVPNGMPLPAPAECPAIAIFPLPSTDGWDTNQSRSTYYNLNVSLFTYHLVLPQAEALWVEVARALFTSAPENSNLEYYRQSDFVEQMTISQLAPIPVKSDADNPQSPDVIRWDMPVQMHLRWHPSSPVPLID
jgi:hypothetical protein